MSLFFQLYSISIYDCKITSLVDDIYLYIIGLFNYNSCDLKGYECE